MRVFREPRAAVSDKVLAYVTAALLSLLTLTVFAYLKDTGPESALRLYHQHVLSGNFAESDKMVDPESGGAASEALYETLGRILGASGQQPRLGRVVTEGRSAYVDVTYFSKLPGNIMTVRFVVKKPGYRWKIDAAETLNLARKMSEL